MGRGGRSRGANRRHAGTTPAPGSYPVICLCAAAFPVRSSAHKRTIAAVASTTKGNGT